MHEIDFLQDKINKEVNSLCEELHLEPEDLYDPISYTLSLGGKRMRPVLLLMGCELFGGDIERAVPPALAIELFHNFTLVHDDIMDNAPLRRNHPSVYNKWNSNTAILSGDAMLVKAYQYISKCDRTILPKVLDVFNDGAIKVCEGQQLDMNYEDQDNITVSDYMGMIGLKTAALLAASLQIGAFIGGASDEDAQHLCDFGKSIGMAFQLLDDVLDVYGNQQKFGKQLGGDIVSNKKTFLLLKALELAEGEMLNELRTILGTKDFDPVEKVKTVKRIYDQLNIKERTKEKMQYYHRLGLKQLSEIKISEEKKTVLISFTESLMVREI